MKRCTKCIMPDTKPGISFNEVGVCNACQSSEENDKVNWDARLEKLLEFVCEASKKDDYNILIPVSGGKDSTYLAITARDSLGLNPLCVNVAPCKPTPLGERNLANLSKLGFDVVRFFPNQEIMPELVKRSFYEDGDPCTSHEFMLYGFPLQMAVKFKIPIILWAENSQIEYGNTDIVCGIDGRSHEHWISDNVCKTDLIPFKQVNALGTREVYLSEYMRWDSRKVAESAIANGLEIRPQEELLGTGGYWPFEQLDDEMPVIGHYLKWLKFGYGRATDQACRDIRLGYITRDEGLRLAKTYDGRINPNYVENFCNYIDINKVEFDRVCNGFRK